MVLSALFALSVLAGQDTIKLDLKAAPIASILEQVDTKTGANLRASAALAHEVVFVQVDGVSLADLKSRLAEVMSASWVVKTDGEYLERTPDQQREIWTRHLASRAAMIQESLGTVRKVVEKPFDGKALANGLAALRPADEFGDDRAGAMVRYKAERALFESGPMGRLLRKLLLACDPKDLAAIGPHERRIFTLNPTRMQRGFNKNQFDQALAAFAKEQTDWAEAAAKVNFPTDNRGRMVSDPRSQLDYEAEKLRSVRLEVKRGEMTALFNVNLLGHRDPFPGVTVLTQADFEDAARRFMNAQMNPTAPGETDPAVELSADSKTFQARLSQAFSGRTPDPMTPEFRELLLNVDKHEPLGLATSDALVTYANHKKVNLIAALPDNALGAAWFVSTDQKPRAEQIVRAIVNLCGVELRESGKWALLVPLDRWEHALDFTPRGPVAELVKAVDAKAALDPRDYARYAYRSGRGWRMGLGDIWLGLYSPSFLGASDFTDWNGLRLYGSFPLARQRELEDGKKFPITGLTPEQRKIVEAIVYAGPIASEQKISSNLSQQLHEPIEPTDAFANGVPADAVVSGSSREARVLVAYGKASDGSLRPLRKIDHWTIAAVELEVVGNTERMARYGVPGLVGYAPGKEKMIAIRVELGPGIWKESTLMVPEYDPNAKPVAWDKLSPEDVKVIANAIEQTRARKNQGGTTPPPR